MNYFRVENIIIGEAKPLRFVELNAVVSTCIFLSIRFFIEVLNRLREFCPFYLLPVFYFLALAYASLANFP